MHSSRRFSRYSATTKETTAAKECPVCSDQYNENERSPRSLPCSHTLCSACIQNLIARNTKTCPFCRQRFNADNARDIGVNTSLMDVLKLLRDVEQRANATSQASSATTRNWRKFVKSKNEKIAQQNVSLCRVVKDCINTTIQSNNEIRNNLSQVNDVIQNEIIIVGLNDIMSKNNHIIRCREEENKKLERQSTITNKIETKLQDGIRNLSLAESSYFASSIFDEVEGMNSKTTSWLRGFQKHLEEVKESHNKIKRVIENTEGTVRVFQDMLRQHGESEENIPVPNYPLMAIKEIIPEDITIETLREKRATTMEKLRQGKVFALQLFERDQRYAKISIDEENRICLHHLRKESPPENVKILTHNDVMSLVSSSSTLTFLELSDVRQQFLARIYIRLLPDSKRAKQFTILCTGEKGPTYAGTSIVGSYDKDSSSERILLGDFDFIGSNRSEALVEGANTEEGGMLKRSWLKGSVQGICPWGDKSQEYQFYIYTKDRPGNHLNYCFGMVQKGLDILTEKIKSQDSLHNVLISDSGIVLID